LQVQIALSGPERSPTSDLRFEMCGKSVRRLSARSLSMQSNQSPLAFSEIWEFFKSLADIKLPLRGLKSNHRDLGAGKKRCTGGFFARVSLSPCRDWSGWLGRQDSNLGMAESKSDQFSFEINAHSEKNGILDRLSINRLLAPFGIRCTQTSHKVGLI